MKNGISAMSPFSFFLVLSILTGGLSFAKSLDALKPAKVSCHELFEISLSAKDAYLLQLSKRLGSGEGFPAKTASLQRYVRLQAGDTPFDPTVDIKQQKIKNDESFSGFLKAVDISLADWDLLKGLRFPKGLIIGSKAFSEYLVAAELSGGQRSTLEKLQSQADAVREKVKTHATRIGAAALQEHSRFLRAEAFIQRLREHVRDPAFNLTDIGIADYGDWQKRILIEQPKLKEDIKKAYRKSFREFAEQIGKIPEHADSFIDGFAKHLRMDPADLKLLFGENSLFLSTDTFIDETKSAYEATFNRIVDQRVFSAERNRLMLSAVKAADAVILMKLVENSDLDHFGAIEQYARENNAVIIVSPAFSELGSVPAKLDYLFKHPLVHFQVDPILQLDKRTLVINSGAIDKVQSPLTGLNQVFDPTKTVFVYSPKVRSERRPNGYYDQYPGMLTTTGSMSKPAYRSNFNVGMVTDFRAQQEAISNMGFTVLSKGYSNSGFDWVESQTDLVPRRVLYTQAQFGNPAGLFDRGLIYSGEGAPVQVPYLPGLVLGDLHTGATDPGFAKDVLKLLVELKVLQLNPDFGAPGQIQYIQGPVKLGNMVIHDAVDGSPFNGHTLDRLITRAKMDESGSTDLSSHIQEASNRLNGLARMIPETTIVIPIDNHGYDWWMKVLQNGDFYKNGSRPRDLPVVLASMQNAMSSGIHPYEHLLRYFGLSAKNVHFLRVQDDLRVGFDPQRPNPFSVLNGVSVGTHGFMGVNGAKGISVMKMLQTYGPNVTGHTHASAEVGQSKKVGTGTSVRQSYHAGPSSSDQSVLLIYSETAAQLLYRADGGFLPSNDPKAVERAMTDGALRFEAWPDPVGGRQSDQFKKENLDRHLRTD